MSETRALETVLADAFDEAHTLERNRAAFSVDRVREILHAVKDAAEPFTTWLSERDASIRRGKSEAWMRQQFAAMERDGNARLSGRSRQYRQCAVPQRAQTAAMEQRGREAARALKRPA